MSVGGGGGGFDKGQDRAFSRAIVPSSIGAASMELLGMRKGAGPLFVPEADSGPQNTGPSFVPHLTTTPQIKFEFELQRRR